VAGFDVVAIGEPLYELNRQADGRYLAGCGGDTLNAAIAAARLGARAAYITRLGGDFFADELRAVMQRESIDTTAVLADPDAPTGLYFVTHGPHGHVFTYRRKDSAASLMRPADLDARLIASARFLHASGISQAISRTAADTVAAAIAMARRAGTGISFDTNFRPRLWSAADAWPVISAAAAHADILKTSAEDCAALFGESEPQAIARRFLAAGAKAVVVTLGKHGACLAREGATDFIPGYAVAAVDATGAGDAFTGALLAELTHGQPLPAAARFANAAAALSTLGYGAVAPLPDRPAVHRFLDQSRPPQTVGFDLNQGSGSVEL
jgi:2-dehydro-3-deoxygluconokinase